jgi:drug/metabolite transporter (DMT)-like permease
VVVGSLPLTLPATLWWWPTGTTPSITAWGGLLYVGLFSMWLGFFAWGGFKSEAQQRLQWMEVEG